MEPKYKVGDIIYFAKLASIAHDLDTDHLNDFDYLLDSNESFIEVYKVTNIKKYKTTINYCIRDTYTLNTIDSKNDSKQIIKAIEDIDPSSLWDKDISRIKILNLKVFKELESITNRIKDRLNE